MLDVDTAFLHTFLLVARKGSMSEAARQLDLSPTAVAQQMRVLERELGASLLQRAGRTVRPTEAGHRLMEKAEALVREAAGLRTWVHGDELQHEIHVGTVATLLHSALPDILQEFTARYPHTRVSIRAGLAGHLNELVAEGAVDVALTLQPGYDIPKTLEWRMLREEPLVVLAHSRLAGSDPLRLLREQPLIRYDRTLGGGKLADQFLRDAGIVPQERFELNSLLAVSMMVERDLGVALVPDTISPFRDAQALVRIPLPQARAARVLGLLWLRASPKKVLIKAFGECAEGVMRSDPPSL
nr:LysR family transcriptional regulator [Ottowia thiooxydans]